MLKPLMFWEGDTATLIEDEEVGDEEDLATQVTSDSSLQGNVTGRYGRGTNGVTIVR
jgi:hypothetical protein